MALRQALPPEMLFPDGAVVEIKSKCPMGAMDLVKVQGQSGFNSSYNFNQRIMDYFWCEFS
jgi:hypothetical protein